MGEVGAISTATSNKLGDASPFLRRRLISFSRLGMRFRRVGCDQRPADGLRQHQRACNRRSNKRHIFVERRYGFARRRQRGPHTITPAANKVGYGFTRPNLPIGSGKLGSAGTPVAGQRFKVHPVFGRHLAGQPEHSNLAKAACDAGLRQASALQANPQWLVPVGNATPSRKRLLVAGVALTKLGEQGFDPPPTLWGKCQQLAEVKLVDQDSGNGCVPGRGVRGGGGGVARREAVGRPESNAAGQVELVHNP